MPFKHLLLLLIQALLLESSLSLVVDNETTPPSERKSDRSDFKKSLSRDCASTYSPTCLKLDLVTWMDRLDSEETFNLLPGVAIVKEASTARSHTDLFAGLARDFPHDPKARLDAFLLTKLSDYVSSHSMRLNLWAEPTATGRQGGGGGLGGGGGKGGGGGGGKGGGGGLHLLLAAGAMMKGTLMALAIGGIAAIAGKALMTALISLVLSGIIGLKALTHHGHKSTTYEVISKPVYSHAQTHSSSHVEEHPHGGYGHSSYGRSFDSTMVVPLGVREEYKPPQ